jgi:hypothetical protein
MKMFVATMVAATLLAGPAFAQGGKSGPPPNDPRREQAAKAEKERDAIEQKYNETMARIRSQGPPPKTDPWARMRPADGADTKR